MKRCTLLAMFAVTFAAGVAHADDEVTPEPTPAPTPIEPTDMSGGVFKKGTLGISVAVPGNSPPYAIDLVYFLNKKAAVDILAGVNIAKTPEVMDPMTGATVGGTSFGFAIGVGYRVYKKINERLHTYVQPFGLLNAPATDDIGNQLQILAGVNFGAEAFLTDWFSFRGQIGGAVSFAQSFDVINLASTTGLFANVYWK